jgi:hypothetical protein
MKARTKKTQGPSPLEVDALLQLELKVAKRADNLWRSAGYGSGEDLVHWLQAEREVLEQQFGVKRPTPALLAAGR